MSILTGYAIPTGIPGADHTYVKSDNPPFTWPCWGRSEGGRIICQGNGNASIANCLSQPNSWAGIVYGVTGVCHQTANRILYPARAIVSDAAGYWASVTLYGTYGTNTIPSAIEWETRKAICGAQLAASPASIAESNSEGNPEREYMQKLMELHSKHEYVPINSEYKVTAEKVNNLIIKELEYMLEFRLDGKVESQIFNQIQKQQASLLKEKDKKVNELYNGDISTEKYVKEINDIVGDSLASLQENLGEDLFEKIFNLPARKEKFILIDPDIAKGSINIKTSHK